MKRIVLLLCLLVVSTASAQKKINWMSMDEALAAQAKKPKKIFIDMYTNWCGPCKMLDRDTFSNQDVVNYINQNFYAVKFNAEGNETVSYQSRAYTNPGYNPAKAMRRNSQHQFARYMGVRAYPTVLFLDEQGNLINRVQSYKKPQQMELYLKLFGTDLWKEISTQEQFDEYFKNFKPEFKA
ncbi:thioredoxin fold domain-containing protein [Aureisphaera galaxeae]|uniref:thioredoxin family protein n=1 Tax=Aureisphaera galaxeae TaxID=1538023 RepID=UPI002350D4D9|nr:thioredoxin fold domain-containing protein [Aureisphaera galaxeae]MDC8003026.1 thioredoxin fold domain-containing protein [Aureisphaera galaxeae]